MKPPPQCVIICVKWNQTQTLDHFLSCPCKRLTLDQCPRGWGGQNKTLWVCPLMCWSPACWPQEHCDSLHINHTEMGASNTLPLWAWCNYNLGPVRFYHVIFSAFGEWKSIGEDTLSLMFLKKIKNRKSIFLFLCLFLSLLSLSCFASLETEQYTPSTPLECTSTPTKRATGSTGLGCQFTRLLLGLL